MQFKAKRYDNGEAVQIEIQGEHIERIASLKTTGTPTDLPFVAPGFFDHQINGYGGTWFSGEELTPDTILTALEAHYQYGITRMFPTLTTSSFESLAGGFQALRQACEQEHWADQMVPGLHLEGPYISSEDGPRGGHSPRHIRAADWDEFCRLQEISGGRIRLLTLAPEVDGAIEVIHQAVKTGVVISIGHTGATPEQIRAAVDAGARMSTHLGNGAHGTLRRHPNYIWEQLGEPRLAAGIIADGHHLPASVIRSIIGAKGIENTFLTCDASGLAGCPPGRYSFQSIEVEKLADGPIFIAGQRQMLAGSGQQTDVCVANVMTFARVTLQQAFDMAGRYPARLLLGDDEIHLHHGSRADLVIFRYAGHGHRLEFLTTIAAGEVRFGVIPTL